MEVEKRGVLYERCGKCGGVFDLNFDFESEEKEFGERIPLHNLMIFKQFCWACRDE